MRITGPTKDESGTTGANLTVTMTAFKGSSITVVARGTKWLLASSSNVTSITV